MLPINEWGDCPEGMSGLAKGSTRTRARLFVLLSVFAWVALVWMASPLVSASVVLAIVLALLPIIAIYRFVTTKQRLFAAFSHLFFGGVFTCFTFGTSSIVRSATFDDDLGDGFAIILMMPAFILFFSIGFGSLLLTIRGCSYAIEDCRLVNDIDDWEDSP